MIKITMDMGECNTQMNGSTVILLSEATAIVSALYKAIGDFKGAPDDKDYGKRKQKDFKDVVLSGAPFEAETVDLLAGEKDDKEKEKKVRSLADMEKALIDILKELSEDDDD